MRRMWKSAQGGAAPAAREEVAERVLVRDAPVRVFHWTLVVAVATAGFTGFLGAENLLQVHVYAGHVIAVLVVFRMLWWGMGGRYSRLRAYPLAPRALIVHLRDLMAGRSVSRAGHNPAGAAMILVLVSLLALLVVSGLVVLGGQELQGPLHALVSYEMGEGMARAHEILAWLLLAAIAGHVSGVALEVAVFRHPLLRAMTSGHVALPRREAEEGLLVGRGLLALGLALGLYGGLGVALAALPQERWRLVEAPGIYAENCGDCHHAHHPSLRTGDMWARVVASLEDHYGEDASLSDREAREILAFLTRNDATRFDTEAAVRIGRAESADLRISSTTHWKRRHAALPAAIFSTRAVGSRANCHACHADAASGRFDDARIAVPPAAWEELTRR